MWLLREAKSKLRQSEWKGNLLLALIIPVKGRPRRNLLVAGQKPGNLEIGDSVSEMELGFSFKPSNCLIYLWTPAGSSKDIVYCGISVYVYGLNDCQELTRKYSKMCSLPFLAALGSHRTLQISFSVAALVWQSPVQ